MSVLRAVLGTRTLIFGERLLRWLPDQRQDAVRTPTMSVYPFLPVHPDCYSRPHGGGAAVLVLCPSVHRFWKAQTFQRPPLSLTSAVGLNGGSSKQTVPVPDSGASGLAAAKGT